jgi:hypothetical protein
MFKSATRLCDEFAAAITSFTNHSTKGKFSRRGRVIINFHESKINKFNRELGDCQRNMAMVLVLINL